MIMLVTGRVATTETFFFTCRFLVALGLGECECEPPLSESGAGASRGASVALQSRSESLGATLLLL